MNEISIMQKTQSHFVVGYIDSYSEDTKIYIVMEYCQNGDLCTYMEKNKKIKLSDNFVWKALIHICLGLNCLHEQNVVHRDLKTLNIFLTKEKACKLGDLGEARWITGKEEEEETEERAGTPYYLAPELWCKK